HRFHQKEKMSSTKSAAHSNCSRCKSLKKPSGEAKVITATLVPVLTTTPTPAPKPVPTPLLAPMPTPTPALTTKPLPMLLSSLLPRPLPPPEEVPTTIYQSPIALSSTERQIYHSDTKGVLVLDPAADKVIN